MHSPILYDHFNSDPYEPPLQRRSCLDWHRPNVHCDPVDDHHLPILGLKMKLKIKKIQMCPHNTELHKHMKMRQRQNLIIAIRNPNENWLKKKLEEQTDLKWTRQAIWGFRLFDFWNSKKGIAVEVDGPDHDKKKFRDSIRDNYNFKRSGVLVFRIKNLCEEEASIAIEMINKECLWWERRKNLGLKYESSSFGFKQG